MNSQAPTKGLHQCLRSFPGIVLELDAAGVVRDSNGKLEKRLGSQIIGRQLAEVLDATSQRKWQRLLAADGTSGSSTLELLLSWEQSIEMCTFLVVRGEDPSTGMIWLVEHPRDPQLTMLYEEISAVNSELVNTQRDLAKEKARLSRALAAEEKAREEALAAVGTRDEVLAVVSHDLRNPVHTIVMMAALLLDFPLSEEQQREKLKIIKRGAERMNRLIQDLLDVATIESGRLSLGREALAVSGLLAEACQGIRARAAERSVAIECHTPESAPKIYADHDRLLQVFGNLLDNAVKFTPEGGQVTISAFPLESEVCFSVSDTGPGIAEADRARLFERFWQVRATGRTGVGLGLAISREIVEAHGGRIWVESEEGRGSTFFFTVPLAN